MASLWKYPRVSFLFILYCGASFLAILVGGFLIEASMFPFALGDAYSSLENLEEFYGMSEKDREDLSYMSTTGACLGSLSSIFALVFAWNATELGIVLFLGRKTEDLCLFDRQTKNELRQILAKP